ncbi:lysophospholipid acyltransferase LPEAT2-like [Silene latifolia]
MAEQQHHTLSTPLLSPIHQIPSNSNSTHHNHDHTITIQEPTSENPQIDHQNPYLFLGIDEFCVKPSSLSTADPFRNHTPTIEGVYEWFKIVICLPIALIRLILFGLCLLVGYIATKLALYGWKDRHNPMPRWRSRLMWVTRFSARCILFSFGYQWIKRKGRPVSREIAPIVVSNHVSYIDPIFYFYELFPSIVSSDSHDSIPFVGTIIRAMQVIYVNRFSPASRKNAITEIKRMASCNRFPRVLLFPEGTTTNGKFLLSFQMGAFVAGYPIQPVIVRYPYVHFDQSWGNISLGRLMFRMFTQFHNFMEVEYLPVIPPLRSQKENAADFAERTANAMATALNVVQTSYGYGDMLLLNKAVEMKKENPSRFMAELAHADLPYRISTTEALEFLEKFLSMNPDNNGCVNIDDFVGSLKLKRCDLSEKIVAFVFSEKGKINFKQFLIASTRVMNQPLFQRACEFSFIKCSDDSHEYVSREKFGDAIREAIPDASDSDVIVLFNMLDVDGDGRVRKHDFLKCLRKNPLLIALFSPLLQDEFSHTSNGLLELEEIIC